jgi:hypothetical protein
MNNYNESWIKRRAKEIKKTKQIPHHEALDDASTEAGFQNWQHFLNSEKPLSHSGAIRAGMLVRFKERNWLAVAVSQNGEHVKCYTHWGTLGCLRSEISICRDQIGAASFQPMRIVLPYGKWTCADGTEVLFNRDYRPIWKKQPDGTVKAADPNEWIIFAKQDYLFGDHNTPHEDRNSYQRCINQLRDWGVLHGVPVMLDLFRHAVAEGDLTRIERPSPYDFHLGEKLESRG